MTPERLPFRQLDNSATTRLSYDLETKHWMDSIKSAQASKGTSIGGSLGVVGIFISVLISVILIILSVIWGLLGGKSPQQREDEANSFDPNRYPHTPNYLEEVEEEYFHTWK